MNAAYRNAVRNGAMAAERLHRQLGSRRQVELGSPNVDVFGTIVHIGIPLVLRPLEGLLGAYLRWPASGILVTTRRPLSVQRFTAAHELGHFQLNHAPSLDDEGMLRRSPIADDSECALQEVEADAFAMGFLMPRWLIALHAKRQGWQLNCFSKPHVVYQLSLRVGASFEATWRTLWRYNLITSSAVTALENTKIRDLKKALLRNYVPPDYRRDVWLLTERDADASISGSQHDLLVFRLVEHGGGGYLWDARGLERAGFSLVGDVREKIDDIGIGNPISRQLTVALRQPKEGKISLTQCRPWQPRKPLTRIDLTYNLTGPEREGYSWAERRRVMDTA